MLCVTYAGIADELLVDASCKLVLNVLTYNLQSLDS